MKAKAGLLQTGPARWCVLCWGVLDRACKLWCV